MASENGDHSQAANEAKEAARRRKAEARKFRLELRRQKWKLKGDAKRARQANVQRAAKWSDERKALDKIRKAENRARKREKLQRRMEQLAAAPKSSTTDTRSPKVEETTKKETKKEKKTKKEKRTKKEKKTKNETKSKKENKTEKENKTKESKGGGDPKGKGEEGALGAPTEDTHQEVEVGLDQVKPAKKPTTDQVMPEDDGIVNAELLGQTAKKSKAKDANEQPEAEDVDGTGTNKKMRKSRSPEVSEKKQKKSKQKGVAQMEDTVTDSPAERSLASKSRDKKQAKEPEPKSKEDRKALKKRKRREEKAAKGDYEDGEVSAPKEKRAKHDPGPSLILDNNPPALAENWNVQGLGGGADRKKKFIKLLGGDKHGIHPAEAGAPLSNDKFNSASVEADLDRQCQAGVRMKNDPGGKRKGLGA